MPTTINLRKLLHRKAWEACTSSPTSVGAGSFFASDKYDLTNGARAFAVMHTTGIFIYEGLEDGWMQIPSPGIAGSINAGSCGEFRGLGAMGGVFTQTATAGTTTTLTTARTMVRGVLGSRVRVVGGAGVGYEGTVGSVVLGANSIITVTPASAVAFSSTTQFQVYSGSFWVQASAAGAGFAVYDLATNVWTQRAAVGVAWGTDGVLCSTVGSAGVFASGTATSGGASTLTNSAKAWSTNMWANYQLRITDGVGEGQIRTISSNTGTAITLSATWTTNPDATSVYAIEGNDDFFYLTGNNAVAIYRYSVSSNTWTTLVPTAARSGVQGAGATLSWIDQAPNWTNEIDINHITTIVKKQNGRYLYSLRGAGSAALDIYDIAANTWINDISYGGRAETFNAGSSGKDIDGSIVITKEATGRIFRFDVDANRLSPLATNTNQTALGGGTLVGEKSFILQFTDGASKLTFFYTIRHSAADMVRMLLV